MFGNPAWFSSSSGRWGVKPRQWQAWGYLAVWGVVIALPATLLVSSEKSLEALIWCAASSIVGAYDLSTIRQQLIPQVSETSLSAPPIPAEIARNEDLLYIGDDESADELLNVRYARHDRRA
ncbi:hypothetical protein Psta_3652 [Pirellula staleyi DSM 6068]|uniref:Uncharacterized protein n=1 Tax=Pirellula staleyi (strain ATCC 27377 / DSM 6068 / ICPB 4128) TaxID=530564 RepID=D2QZC0_PIRSD|nr:hypothetical protein [Pirellula staleyi]ADB18312.1 hypothetical protein Psta_3652 [Pirellula staleyi DSM 6068]